jgi:hypothetical protein|uniref:Uncharacterized protein n=2 Tax=Zea mays TaxID=4577 RepID=C0P9E6_MAIZE|nr:unknown [Zea mays]
MTKTFKKVDCTYTFGGCAEESGCPTALLSVCWASASPSHSALSLVPCFFEIPLVSMYVSSKSVNDAALAAKGAPRPLGSSYCRRRMGRLLSLSPSSHQLRRRLLLAWQTLQPPWSSWRCQEWLPLVRPSLSRRLLHLARGRFRSPRKSLSARARWRQGRSPVCRRRPRPVKGVLGWRCCPRRSPRPRCHRRLPLLP